MNTELQYVFEHHPLVQGKVYDALTADTTTLMFEAGWGML